MKHKEYKFKQGFTIKTRLAPCGVFHAMGEVHITQNKVFDLYHTSFTQTYETFKEAVIAGKLSKP